MAEYKSEVKQVYYPIENVYDKLSDLTNLAVIQQNVDNPELQKRILEQAGDKLTPEKLAEVADKIRALQFTPDTVSGQAGPVGNVTLRIIEREPNKTIKFAVEGAPIQANLWIQLLPASDTQCAMRLTLKADLNFFIKQMIGSKLKEGVNGLAQMLAQIPYGY